MSLDRDAYFTVQQIYRGWALSGILIAIKIIIDLIIGLLASKRNPRVSRAAFTSAALIGLGLVAFFLWVQPENSATHNWTVRPDNWMTIRRSWEYGHIAIAVLTLIAFGFSTTALLAATSRPRPMN